MVTNDMIEQFINETKYKFNTSALRQDTNIDEIFNEISEDIMEKYLSIGDKEQKLKLLKIYTKPKQRNSNCICNLNGEN